MAIAQLEAALNEAIQDEYKARATYYRILEKFGMVRPFANIVRSEERHIQALLGLFRRYNLPVPVDSWPLKINPPETLADASREGVQGEIENGEMYRRLLAMTRDYPDVQRVFLNLQRASQENHLPAFKRSLARYKMSPHSSVSHAAGDRYSPRCGDRGGRRRRQRNGHRCGRIAN